MFLMLGKGYVEQRIIPSRNEPLTVKSPYNVTKQHALDERVTRGIKEWGLLVDEEYPPSVCRLPMPTG